MHLDMRKSLTPQRVAHCINRPWHKLRDKDESKHAVEILVPVKTSAVMEQKRQDMHSTKDAGRHWVFRRTENKLQRPSIISTIMNVSRRSLLDPIHSLPTLTTSQLPPHPRQHMPPIIDHVRQIIITANRDQITPQINIIQNRL